MRTTAELLAPLRTPSGGFAMLALDQRESLRGMFGRTEQGEWVGDEQLTDFKSIATEVLSPHASAVLLDRPFAVQTQRPAGLAAGSALIVAADILYQVPGEAVHDTAVDPEVTIEYLQQVQAEALKFLVMWRPGSGASKRVEMIHEVVELARAADVASLVEAVVLTDDGSDWASDEARHEAVLSAAEEVAQTNPDVYKAQVPGYRSGEVGDVETQARELSAIVPCEWVVLSNGVQRDDFAEAVAAACRGGASGFLAGRAIWADVVGAADQRAALEAHSVPRLKKLQEIVERTRTAD